FLDERRGLREPLFETLLPRTLHAPKNLGERIAEIPAQRTLPRAGDIGGIGILAGELRRQLLHLGVPAAGLSIEAVDSGVGLVTEPAAEPVAHPAIALGQLRPPRDGLVPARHRRARAGHAGASGQAHAGETRGGKIRTRESLRCRRRIGPGAQHLAPAAPVLPRQCLELLVATETLIGHLILQAL